MLEILSPQNLSILPVLFILTVTILSHLELLQQPATWSNIQCFIYSSGFCQSKWPFNMQLWPYYYTVENHPVASHSTQDKVQRAHSGMNHSPHSSGLIFGFYSLHVLSGFQVFGNLFSAWNHHAHLSSSYLALQPGWLWVSSELLAEP